MRSFRKVVIGVLFIGLICGNMSSVAYAENPHSILPTVRLELEKNVCEEDLNGNTAAEDFDFSEIRLISTKVGNIWGRPEGNDTIPSEDLRIDSAEVEFSDVNRDSEIIKIRFTKIKWAGKYSAKNNCRYRLPEVFTVTDRVNRKQSENIKDENTVSDKEVKTEEGTGERPLPKPVGPGHKPSIPPLEEPVEVPDTDGYDSPSDDGNSSSENMKNEISLFTVEDNDKKERTDSDNTASYEVSEEKMQSVADAGNTAVVKKDVNDKDNDNDSAVQKKAQNGEKKSLPVTDDRTKLLLYVVVCMLAGSGVLCLMRKFEK